jgi:hypothetical protein
LLGPERVCEVRRSLDFGCLDEVHRVGTTLHRTREVLGCPHGARLTWLASSTASTAITRSSLPASRRRRAPADGYARTAVSVRPPSPRVPLATASAGSTARRKDMNASRQARDSGRLRTSGEAQQLSSQTTSGHRRPARPVTTNSCGLDPSACRLLSTQPWLVNSSGVGAATWPRPQPQSGQVLRDRVAGRIAHDGRHA